MAAGRIQYLAVDSRGRTVDFISSRRNSKAAYRFLGKILNNVKKRQILRFINTDKAPAYGRALALLKREGWRPSLTLNTDRLVPEQRLNAIMAN